MADIYLSKWTGTEIDNAIEKAEKLDTNITSKTNKLVSDLTITGNVLTVSENNGDRKNYDLPANNAVVIHFTYDSTTSVYVPETGYEIADVINEIKNGKVVIFIINNHAYYAFEYSKDESNLWINGMEKVGVYSNSATDPWIGTSYYQWSVGLGGAQYSTYNTTLEKATHTTGGLLTGTDKEKINNFSSLIQTGSCLYYDEDGTNSYIDFDTTIPDNSLIIVVVKYAENYMTANISHGDHYSMTICAKPMNSANVPVYRNITFYGNNVSVGDAFLADETKETANNELCKICAIYYIPYST